MFEAEGDTIGIGGQLAFLYLEIWVLRRQHSDITMVKVREECWKSYACLRDGDKPIMHMTKLQRLTGHARGWSIQVQRWPYIYGYLRKMDSLNSSLSSPWNCGSAPSQTLVSALKAWSSPHIFNNNFRYWPLVAIPWYVLESRGWIAVSWINFNWGILPTVSAEWDSLFPVLN